MIKLGSKVIDTISGFTGVVIAETNWLYGCRRITVAADKLQDGIPIESQTFDAQQLTVIIEDTKEIKSINTGGERGNPKRTGF